MNLGYRVRQFWLAVNAEPLPVAVREEIDKCLSKNEQAVFYRCSIGDQWHGYRVLRTLVDSGEDDPDLRAAALLHDCGKAGRNLTVWSRSWIVIGEKLFPTKVDNWAENRTVFWQQPFAVRKYHARWGADFAEESGSSPLTVALIKRHQDVLDGEANSHEDRLLQKLQWADNLN